MGTAKKDYLSSLLGNDLFLKQFTPQLRALNQDAAFMNLINQISAEASKNRCDFEAEKNLAKKAFYEQAIYFKFPEYKKIADTVKGQGYAKASAAISTYCAMRMKQESQGISFENKMPGEALTPSTEPADYVPTDDEDAERWNEICFLVNRYRTPNATERDFQIEAENIFEKLGWSRYKGEVASQVTIPVGAAQSVRPDIVLNFGGQNALVVELKKPNAGISSRNIDQLFSYMRLLKLDYGILIGDTIQVYFDDPETMDAPVQIVEIPFIANSADGVEFCKTIAHEDFSSSRLNEYAKSLMQRGSMADQVQELFKLLCSAEAPSLVRQALFQFFCERYAPEVVNRTLDRINIEAAIGSSSPTDPKHNDEYSDMKVGELANKVLRALLENGAASDEELVKMQSANYSKAAFDLNYPLLVPARAPHTRVRYYANPLTIKGVEYKLCSQWFENASNNDRPYLLRWIREHR